MRAPHARYRLYTSWRSYLPFLRDLVRSREAREAITRFRAELGEYLGAESVATTPMGRTGIYLAVKHLIRPGQDVVMSPYTIADVVNMVIAAGGRPVFADIERSTCNLRPESVEPLLHPGTGAVLVTHLHGIPARINAFVSLCRSTKTPLIEDVAQALGATVEERRLGTFGDVGVYSFGTYKNLCTWFGGAIVCRDPQRLARIQSEVDAFESQSRRFLLERLLKGLVTDVATHPLTFRSVVYRIFRFARLRDIQWINRFVETELDLSRRESLPPEYLGRMTPAQHRLGSSVLDHVDRDNRTRAEKAARYRKGLENVASLLLPPADAAGAIYTYFPIQFGNGAAERARLIRHLAERGCDIGPQHLKNCADLPAFHEFRRDCPNARKTAEAVVLLPSYPRYPSWNIDRNVSVLCEYAARFGS